MVKNITAWALLALPLGSVVAIADPIQTHIVHPVYYHVRTIGGVELLDEGPAFDIGFAAPAAIGGGFADPMPAVMKAPAFARVVPDLAVAGLLTPKPLAPAQSFGHLSSVGPSTAGFGHGAAALPLADAGSGARIPVASMAVPVH
jgi:hypothetical protein